MEELHPALWPIVAGGEALQRWVDFSKWQGDVSNASLRAMLADGIVGVCVGSWHGIDANPYVESVLRRARALGLLTATYVIMNGRPGAWTVQQGKAACGSEWQHLTFVSPDVEVAGVTEAILRDAIAEIERLGHRPLVYTGGWFWSFWAISMGHFPNVGEPDMWLADYDDVPALDSRIYLGMGKQVAKQIHGSRQKYGTTVDGNVFDAAWVGDSVPPTPPPPPPPEEDPLMGKILDSFITAGKAVEDEVAAAKLLPKPIKGDKGDTGATGPAGGGTAQQTYTVRSGDTLGKIADSFPGVSWRQIYEANKTLIGSNPDLIQPGQVLIIP